MSMGEALVIARPFPFCQRPEMCMVKSGRTIARMLEEIADGAPLAQTLRVEIGGYEVPPAIWGKVRPKAGTQIAITVMPAGGGDSSKWIRAVLMIVVAIVAWYAAPVLMGAMGASAATIAAYGGMVASGLTMLGTMAVNALVPPPKPKLQMPDGGGGAVRQFALTGTSNQANPYGTVPLVLGEMLYYPPHAALPYTEEVGNGKYMRMMLDLGFGDFDVSDIKIGETPISSYEGVQYEIAKFPTLYSDDIFEDSVGAALNDHDTLVRTTQPEADEIGVVLDFQGLYGATNKGAVVQARAFVGFRYREVGDPTWILAPITADRAINYKPGTSEIRTGSRDPFSVSVSWPVPRGQYEVEVFRDTTIWNGADPGSRVGDATWSGLRTIKQTNPSTTGTTKLALRILATDQLNGTIQTLNVVQRQRVPVLAGGVWTAEFSNNPAWVALWLITTGVIPANPDIECKAVPLRVTLDKIDLQAFEAFAEFCEERELECSMVLDSGAPLVEVFEDVLAAGMGSRAMRDGKISVVWDDPDAVPVGVFTPANSFSFSGQRNFYDMAHGLRVKFINPTASYVTDEIIVLDDGYSYRGKDARGNPSALPAATRFELLDLRAARGAQQAWRAGRYHIAQAKFRPSNYTLEADIEQLRYTRGDIVIVADDVVEWGEGWGRITSIAGLMVTLDSTISYSGAGGYAARITLADGTMAVRNITPAGSVSDSFTLASSVAGLEEGLVVAIGSVTRVMRNLVVTGISPSQDMNASIRLADQAPEIAAFIDNPPDSIVSEATGRTYLDPPDPPKITVVISSQLASPPSDGGTTAPTVTIGVRPSDGYVRSGAAGSIDEPGRCVTAESWMDDGTRARDARAGDVHLCWEPLTGFAEHAIEAVGPISLRPCVRLHLAKGGSWSGSRTTPFTDVQAVQDGPIAWRYAPEMAGQLVYVQRGGVLGLERVASVEDIGEQLVAPASFGGRSFGAGDQADVLVFSHNMRKVEF